MQYKLNNVFFKLITYTKLTLETKIILRITTKTTLGICKKKTQWDDVVNGIRVLCIYDFGIDHLQEDILGTRQDRLEDKLALEGFSIHR